MEKVAERPLLSVAARNLGLFMQLQFGIGAPRSFQGRGAVDRWTFEGVSATFAVLRVRLAGPSVRCANPML